MENNNLEYADNTVLFAESEQELQELVLLQKQSMWFGHEYSITHQEKLMESNRTSEELHISWTYRYRDW
jgi:hypothetical protein